MSSCPWAWSHAEHHIATSEFVQLLCLGIPIPFDSEFMTVFLLSRCMDSNADEYATTHGSGFSSSVYALNVYPIVIIRFCR